MSHQRFRPFCGLLLQMGETSFEFLPHPLFPGDKDSVFCLEGGTAFIYKILDIDTGDFSALKVFKPGFRTKQIAAIAASLTRYEDISALQAKRRLCITEASHPELISTYPELEYAILMPWISAPTWTGLLLNPQLSAAYTREQALNLAQTTASALSDLEAHGLAHADIAGGNIVPAPDRQHIQLLDLENMYIPELPPPQQKSQGTPGYQHRHLELHGQWCPEGDRFAGAILLAEMLTWWDPRVRAHVDEEAESFFKPEELQASETPCLQAVRNTLHTFSPQLLELFDQAWLSHTLADCPPLHAWVETLDPAQAFASHQRSSGSLQSYPSLNGSRLTPDQALTVLSERKPAQSAPPVLVETLTPPGEPVFASAQPMPGVMDTPPAMQVRMAPGLPATPPLSSINPTKIIWRRNFSGVQKSLLLALLALVVLAVSGTLLFRSIAHPGPQPRGPNTISEQSMGGSSGITVVISPTTPGQTPTRSGSKSTPATGSAPGSAPTTGSTPQPTAAPKPTPTPAPHGCLVHYWTLTLSPTYAAGGHALYVSSYCKGVVYLEITTVPASQGHEVDFQICYGLRTINCSAWLAYPGVNVWREVASGLKAGQIFYINGRCTKCTGSSFIVDGGAKY